MTEQIQLNQNDIVSYPLIIPEPAEVRFRVVDEFGDPLENATVNNWIYSAVTDEKGFTEWISVLPSTHEGKGMEVILSDQNLFILPEFPIFSGERKTLEIVVNRSDLISEIPNWIRNNAEWWASGQIDDDSFIEGIQYLIKKNILENP